MDDDDDHFPGWGLGLRLGLRWVTLAPNGDPLVPIPEPTPVSACASPNAAGSSPAAGTLVFVVTPDTSILFLSFLSL